MPSDQVASYRAELMRRIEQQTSEVAELLAQVPGAEWRRRHVAEGSTLHQEVAHLRDLELLAFLPRFYRILTEHRPRLAPFPSHTWTADQYDPDEPLTKILQDFGRGREEALALMRSLPPADWSRLGFHPPSGWRSAQWWIERIYRHAEEHLGEIRHAVQAID